MSDRELTVARAMVLLEMAATRTVESARLICGFGLDVQDLVEDALHKVKFAGSVPSVDCLAARQLLALGWRPDHWEDS